MTVRSVLRTMFKAGYYSSVIALLALQVVLLGLVLEQVSFPRILIIPSPSLSAPDHLSPV